MTDFQTRLEYHAKDIEQQTNEVSSRFLSKPANLSLQLLVYNQNHQCFGNFELSLSVYKTTAPANFMTGILAENLTVDMSACGYFSRITDEEIDLSITSYSDNYVSYIGGWWQLCQ